MVDRGVVARNAHDHGPRNLISTQPSIELIEGCFRWGTDGSFGTVLLRPVCSGYRGARATMGEDGGKRQELLYLDVGWALLPVRFEDKNRDGQECPSYGAISCRRSPWRRVPPL